MNEIRIALTDDHKMFRDGIKSVLSDQSNIKIVAEASSAEEMLQILSKHKIDIVISDIGLPGMSGVELCKEILTLNPEVKVLILSMYNSEEFILNSVKFGASGYLSKETGHEELVFAINKIAQGD